MSRPPIVITFDKKRLRDELARKRVLRDIPVITVPYTADVQQLLQVPLTSYNNLQPGVSRLLDAALPQFKPGGPGVIGALDDQARLALWTRLFVPTLLDDPAAWSMMLLEWSRRRPARWPQQPGINRTLGAAFAREALGVTDSAVISMLDQALRVRAKPASTSGALMQLAFDLEQEKVTDEIVRDSAKLVVLAVLLIVPFGQVPAVIGAVCTAIAGFIQFMQFLEETESKGEITEDDVTEAEWNMLGILPFDFVQLLLLFRALAITAISLLTMLIDAIRSLTESWGRRQQAVKAGWSGYIESPDSAIFIPDFALA